MVDYETLERVEGKLIEYGYELGAGFYRTDGINRQYRIIIQTLDGEVRLERLAESEYLQCLDLLYQLADKGAMRRVEFCDVCGSPRP